MNKNRRISKARKIWDYHYFKDNEWKAVESYLRYIKLRDNNEVVYFRIAVSYWNLKKLEKALFYTNKWLEMSNWDYELLKLKWELLKDLWREKEAKKYLDKISNIDEKNSKFNLDLDKFYSWELKF